MSNSDLDVLIIGGYSPSDVMCGFSSTIRDSIRLTYKNHYASADFIKYLIKGKGDLEHAEKKFQENNNLRFISRSLNTLYLYDFLTKNNFRAEAINYFLLERQKFEELIKLQPKVVVISTTFITNAQEVVSISKAIKEKSPDSIIIVGGIKVFKSFKKHTLHEEGYFNGFDTDPMIKSNFFFDKEIDNNVDIFVIEECGELTLVDLIDKIKNKENFKSTPNIAYHDKGRLVFNKRIKEPYSFENNLIAWDKIPKDMMGNEIPVSAGMGCPFRCSFCDFAGLHKVKIRPISHIIEELSLIQKTFPGIPLFFTDDNLFTNKQRTRELSEAIVKNNLKFKWRAFFRADAISEDNVEILAKAGCMFAHLGLESGDNTILKNMNKRTTTEQNLRAVQLLNANGISTVSTIIIGFPGETKATIDNTIDLLNSFPNTKLPINKYYPLVFILQPLSPITSPENRKKYNIKGGYEQWSHSTMNSDQANGEYLRFFKEVTVPAVAYLEYIDPEISITKITDFAKERDLIVKDGLNPINDTNVHQIYRRFNKVLFS